MKTFRKSVGITLLVVATLTATNAQRLRSAPAIPANTLLRIIRAEDQRHWDNDLALLLADKDAKVRKRAALAAGRIGDDRAVAALAEVLRSNNETDVRQMAAFALGEIESPMGAEVLIALLEERQEASEVRARAVEALGKIGGALTGNSPAASDPTGAAKPEDRRLTKIKTAILDALKFEAGRRAMPDRSTILLGLTAALRTKPDGAGAVIVRFLDYSDPRIVADALNTLARLRLKDNNDEVRKLLTHSDPVVRANAARVLSAAEDKGAFDALLEHAVHDADARVRVNAIRALGSLKDARAIEPLLKHAADLSARNLRERPREANEVLELATALGRISQTSDKPQIELVTWLSRASESFGHSAPELEIAHARVSFANFVEVCSGDRKAVQMLMLDWKAGSSMAQGLGEIATIMESRRDSVFAERAERVLREMLDYRNSGLTINTLVVVHSEYAIPDVLRALAAFKPKDMREVLHKYLQESDVVVRATAAELIGELPPDETNARALIDALPVALRDKALNDAVLSILGALAKQKTAAANGAIRNALNSSDYLVRRRAVALLKENGAGDFSDRIGPVNTRNKEANYRRAIARIGKRVRATLVTTKGQFTIEFLPEDAPLTVDNFIQLAQRGYFNGVTFHRVVPNFVIQGGDPRGDGNGGPGYSIRCEVNEVPYERAALGMALSGKDTGGSQWFVTHSPQPHLDGGYTVFGRVVSGMDIVDSIVRGDIIRRVIVSER